MMSFGAWSSSYRMSRFPVALAEVQRLAARAKTAQWPLPWIGAVASMRSIASARVDELLAEGFGR